MTTTTERRRDKRDRVCYVQGCKSGCKSCKETRSLFRAPIEPERLAEWSRKIPRRDRPFDHACVVCERHFDERFIERTFRTKIKGEIVEIPRDRPLLAKDAVPTIFPEAPKYYTKKLPKKRKERNLCDQVRAKPQKRQKRSTMENACVPTSKEASEGLNCEPGSPQDEHVETTDERLGFSRLRIPKGWSEITLVDAEGLCLYAQCEADAAEPYGSVVMVKSVRIQVGQGGEDSAVGEVHLRGEIWCEQELTTRELAEEFIDSIDKLTLCPGVGVQPLARECPAFNGKFFSKDCSLFADFRLRRACAGCKYQRKLIQNQRSYSRRKAYEDVIFSASAMQQVDEVNVADTRHEPVAEEVAVDSAEVAEKTDTE
ncbi:hypothetical protein HPB52_021776 [Rhipicephalus sanguineus]|uniref:THAP-type domain-containing protein n=1 Tax=Rhipicephalus sanguineus TaxID=34632 RepID=A0A9D4PGI6_RHISA|nr:hypothetical protein HPB52_021776 [Rhipicephalus sanguineus]